MTQIRIDGHRFLVTSLLSVVLATAVQSPANSAPMDEKFGTRGGNSQELNKKLSSTLIVPSQYQTIQLAVDVAKPGDSIKILPGTYIEQLRINKNLQIIGSGEGNTIVKAPQTLAPGSFGRLSIIDIYQGASVSLSHLTVTGPGAGSCAAGSLYGGILVVEDARLHLASATVTKIHDSPKAFCFPNGSAVRVGHVFPQSAGHATIVDVNINEYQGNGVLVLGSGSTATVVDNTITGFGDMPGIINSGVNVARGGSATIIRNTISQNRCTSVIGLDCGRDPINQTQGSGIVVADISTGTSVIHANEVSTSDVGIYLADSANGSVTVSKNRLTNNSFFGIVLQDADYTTSGDKISGGEIGVGVVATTVNTTGTLVGEKIIGTSSSQVKEISCCGFKAAAIVQQSAP